jgi:hypothetical protein
MKYPKLGSGEIVRLDDEDAQQAWKEAMEEEAHSNERYTSNRSDPDIIYAQVHWILRYFVNAEPEDLKRLSKEHKKLVRRCKRLHEEFQNPTEEERKELWKAFAVAIPAGRYSKDDLRNYYKQLHEEVGCPGCMYGILTNDGYCGGSAGNNPNVGCGYVKE